MSISPFIAEREIEDRLTPWDPAAEIVDETLELLHDEELDEVIHDLVGEAQAFAAERRGGRYGADPRGALRAHQALVDRFMPLAADAERLIGEVREAVGEMELGAVSDEQIDTALEAVRPRSSAGSPVFDQFLGGLWKKAKSVVRGATNLVKKGIKAAGSVVVKQILGRLAAFVRPMLSKVIAFALDKLPPSYRAIAGQIAKRFGIANAVTSAAQRAGAALGLPVAATAGLASALGAPIAPIAPIAATASPAPAPPDPTSAAPEPDGSDSADADVVAAEPAAGDVAAVQTELDEQLTELLLANDASESEAIACEYQEHAALAPVDEVAEADAARARFVAELEALGEGEDPTPAVEHFLPALMPVLKMGINLAGRDRVVDFLGGLVGKLIAPVTGAAVAPALGKAIVDTGLRTFLQAEVASAQGLGRVGAEAVASTVEDTARQVAAMPAHVLASPALLESHARDAFDRAAAANMPGSLLRPERREGVDDGAWIAMPRSGRPYYKRYSHVLDVTLTPQMAASVRTFGGATLATFIREQLRLPLDRPLHARVHVYEVLRGGRLSHVAANETIAGLGSPSAWRMLHPLSPHAASLLLQLPRLGRPVPGAPDPLRPREGERVYFLEVEGAPRRVAGRPSHLRVKIDLAKDEVRVCVHLGETLAQKIGTMVRTRVRPAAIIHELRAALGSHARALAANHAARSGVRVIGGATRAHDPGAHARHAIHRVIATHAAEWSWARLAEFFERSGADFLHAVEASPPGVTLRITFEHAPGLDALRAAARGKGTGALTGFPPATTPAATIRVSAGHER